MCSAKGKRVGLEMVDKIIRNTNASFSNSNAIYQANHREKEKKKYAEKEQENRDLKEENAKLKEQKIAAQEAYVQHLTDVNKTLIGLLVDGRGKRAREGESEE